MHPIYQKSSGGIGKSNTKQNNNTINGQQTNKMFDLKMCLLDFMRMTSNASKQKRAQKEEYSQYMSFADSNVIYFNENMSMTSKSSTIKFSRCPTGNFNPNSLGISCPSTNRNRSIRHWITNTAASPFDNFGISSKNMSSSCYECSSSDDRAATTTSKSGISSSSAIESPVSDSSLRETETDEYGNNLSDYATTNICNGSANGNGGLDSFCTLCTSSFSFNRCTRCEDSSCSSKCNLTIQRNQGNSNVDSAPNNTNNNDNNSTKFR